MIKPDLLFPLLESHMKHLIFLAFYWENGSYQVLDEERAKDNEGIFHLQVPPLIYEGVK